MRWMFFILTTSWVTGWDTVSVVSRARSELTSSKWEWTRIWTIYNVDEMNLYTSCIAKYVSQSELKCFMKLQVIYLWQEQAFFLVPSRKQDKPQHEKHANIALYSFIDRKLYKTWSTYILFCTLISSIMNCWIGANHVKVFSGVWIHNFLKTSTEKQNWIKVH